MNASDDRSRSCGVHDDEPPTDAASAGASPLPRLVPRLYAALALVGVLLRLRQYLADRSFWVDEAMLASNIAWRPLGELLGAPLFLDQGAPLGFLLLTKLAALGLGTGERALRLVPFIAGVATVLVGVALCRRLFGQRWPGLVAFTLLCLSPVLVYYSAEMKQYSTDAFAALLLLWLFVVRDDRRSGRLGLAVAGALALWLSHPAAFVLAAVGTVGGVTAWRRRDRAGVRAFVVMAGVWLGLFAMNYWLSLRGLAANRVLVGYWRSGYMPFPILALADLRWFPETLGMLVHMAFRQTAPVGPLFNPAWLDATNLGLGLVVVGGCAALRVRSPHLFAVVAMLCAVNLGLSLLHLYPFRNRLVLYLVPVVYLLAGYAVQWLASRRHGGWQGLAGVLAVVMVLGVGRPALRHARRPLVFAHLRGALEFLVDNRQPEDRIVVSFGCFPAFAFYARQFAFAPDTEIWVFPRDNEPVSFCAELVAQRGAGRAWFLFGHRMEDVPAFLDAMQPLGRLVGAFEAHGAAAYLFELNAVAAAPVTVRTPPGDDGDGEARSQ